MVKLADTKTTAEKMQLNLQESANVVVKVINNNDRNVLNPEGQPA